MARVILFGGHGNIALLTEPLLSGRGDEVTAIIRNPDQADAVRVAGATPLVADVETLDTAELADLIAGHDAVVWSAGAGGGSPERTMAVDRDAAVRSMDAAVLAGVQRYVMVSYFGASIDHGVDEKNSFWVYAEAKAAADEHLRASSLDWTVLGPSTLTFEATTGGIEVHPIAVNGAAALEAPGHVSRETVAHVIAATLSDATTIGRTIAFNDGDTPIAQALRG